MWFFNFFQDILLYLQRLTRESFNTKQKKAEVIFSHINIYSYECIKISVVWWAVDDIIVCFFSLY